MLGPEFELSAADILDQSGTAGGINKPAAIEWVDKHVARRSLVFHQEVSGHSDTCQPDAQTAGDGHVNDRKRDGYAGPPIDYLVEVAVSGIVIVLAVAAVPIPREQIELMARSMSAGSTSPDAA